MGKIINRIKRIKIGAEYAKIARQLHPFEAVPMYLWTKPYIESVVDLLEKEAELDIRFEELLIADNDAESMKIHKYLSNHNAEVLWDLKQRLYFIEKTA